MAQQRDRFLEECFHPSRGRPELRSIAPNTRRAHEHLDKAHKNLRAMQLMFREEHFDWTVVCGYYAMYHAVLAALYHIGIAASSHGCAVAAFRRFYVERGHVPARYTAFLKRAQQLKKRYAESLVDPRRSQSLRPRNRSGLGVSRLPPSGEDRRREITASARGLR